MWVSYFLKYFWVYDHATFSRTKFSLKFVAYLLNKWFSVMQKCLFFRVRVNKSLLCLGYFLKNKSIYFLSSFSSIDFRLLYLFSSYNIMYRFCVCRALTQVKAALWQDHGYIVECDCLRIFRKTIFTFIQSKHETSKWTNLTTLFRLCFLPILIKLRK